MKHLAYLFGLMLLFTTCKKSDTCDGISCKNGGECINGDCDCAPMWIGPDCSQQKTPSHIIINSITVTKSPATATGGAGWDLTSGPDMYVTLEKDGQVLYSTANEWRQNAVTGVWWNVDWIIYDPTATYTLKLWDYDDFDPDDYMGGVIGTFYNNTNGFPSTINFSCQTCTTGFQVPAIYIFI